MTTQHKTFTPVVRGVTGEGKLSFVVATLGAPPDLDADITLPGFFGKQNVALLPAHDHTSVPLGKGRIYERGNEALVEAKFNLAIPTAVDWFEALRFDVDNPPSLQEYSYAYNLHSDGFRTGTHNGAPVRFLTPRKDGSPGADVTEVSPVLRGAGLGTRTLALKRDDDDLSPSDRAELEAIRQKIAPWVAQQETTAALARIERDRAHAMLAEADKPSGATMAFGREVAKLAAERLHLKAVPPVMWFVPGRYPASPDPHVRAAGEAMRSGTINGWADRVKAEIWIASTLRGKDLVSTVLHEVSHLGGREHPESQHFADRYVDEVFGAAHRALHGTTI